MRRNYAIFYYFFLFFFSSRRRHTRLVSDWSSDVCSSDLIWRKSAPIVSTFPFVLYRAILGETDRFSRQDRPRGPVSGRTVRSEERRVGKEGRSRWWADDENKNM